MIKYGCYPTVLGCEEEPLSDSTVSIGLNQRFQEIKISSYESLPMVIYIAL